MFKFSYETLANILRVKDSIAYSCLRSLAWQGSCLVWPCETSVFLSAGLGTALLKLSVNVQSTHEIMN